MAELTCISRKSRISEWLASFIHLSVDVDYFVVCILMGENNSGIK